MIPSILKKLHPNDHYRIRRAVEYFWTAHRPFSLAQKTSPPPWPLCHLYLYIDKVKHWELISKRTDEIIEKGLVNEVEGLLSGGFSGRERPLRAIGYKEAMEYLDKRISTLGELKERITISTRQLAKSQKTFFSAMAPKKQFNPLTDQSPY